MLHTTPRTLRPLPSPFHTRPTLAPLHRPPLHRSPFPSPPPLLPRPPTRSLPTPATADAPAPAENCASLYNIALKSTLLMPITLLLTLNPITKHVLATTLSPSQLLCTVFAMNAMLPILTTMKRVSQAVEKGNTASATYTTLNGAMLVLGVGGLGLVATRLVQGVQASGLESLASIGGTVYAVATLVPALFVARAAMAFTGVANDSTGSAVTTGKVAVVAALVAVKDAVVSMVQFWKSSLGGAYAFVAFEMAGQMFNDIKYFNSGAMSELSRWHALLMFCCFMATVVLKNGADRERLGAGTFTALNQALGGMCVLHLIGGVVWNVSGRMFQLQAPFFVRWGWVFMLAAYVAIVEKDRK